MSQPNGFRLTAKAPDETTMRALLEERGFLWSARDAGPHEYRRALARFYKQPPTAPGAASPAPPSADHGDVRS